MKAIKFEQILLEKINPLPLQQMDYDYQDGRLAWLDKKSGVLGISIKKNIFLRTNVLFRSMSLMKWGKRVLFLAGINEDNVIKVYRVNAKNQGKLWQKHLFEIDEDFLDSHIMEYPLQKEKKADTRRRDTKRIFLDAMGVFHKNKIALLVRNKGVLIYQPPRAPQLIEIDPSLEAGGGERYHQSIHFAEDPSTMYFLSYQFDKKSILKTHLILYDYLNKSIIMEAPFRSKRRVFMGIVDGEHAVFSEYHQRDKEYLFAFHRLDDLSKSYERSFSHPLRWELRGLRIQKEGLLGYRALADSIEFYLWR